MKKLLLIMLALIILQVPVSGQDAVIDSIIVLVNGARNQAGTSRLITSFELTAAAQRHSNDMAGHNSLDHVGSDGSQFWERMLDAGYSLTTGAENILLRSDANAQATFNQWWNSPAHQANMMNPAYVEVGVAYTQSADGTYYFTMVLGTRDGVTAPKLSSPTPLPPTFTPLPPTPTPIPPTATHTPLPTATRTATPLVPPTRTLSPLITPVVFTPLPSATAMIQSTPTPDLPPDIRLIYDAESLTLLNISGRRLDISKLSFRSDSGEMDVDMWETEFLTEPLNNFSDDDCLQVWGLERNQMQDKPFACDTRHGWIAVSNSHLFWQNVSSFFALNDGTVMGRCVVLDGFCELSLDAEFAIESETTSPAPSDRDFRLIFSQDSLTLLNITDKPIDVRGLIFQSTSGSLASEAWNTDFLTSSLSGLPSGDCLMAWTRDTDTKPTPLDCNTRHGWIQVADTESFWSGVSRFDVIRDNRVLAGCVVANGFCDVSLQGNLGALSPTVAPVNPSSSTDTDAPISSSSGNSTSSGTDLTLVYSTDSLALINTSGHVLDISGLVFESDNGVFAASRWNTDDLSRSLSDFPSGDCLQVWGVNEQLQSKPVQCNTRHGWIAVTSAQQFWRNVSQFRVRYGAEQIGTCSISTGQCQINFP